jgi:putative FmdB family regulatory protein
MPHYEYRCEPCDHEFEVFKSMSEYATPESCPKCQGSTHKLISKPNGFINAAVEHPEYNPGLGCVVKNRAHRAQIAKEKGLEEVGNEKPSSMHKAAEKRLGEILAPIEV